MANLVPELRRRIKDTQYAQPAFVVGVSDTGVTSADIELVNGRLILTVAGGTAVRGFDVDLGGERFRTIGALVQALNNFLGVVAVIDRGADPDHESMDLEALGPSSCYPQGVSFRHRTFSDAELDRVIDSAAKRHNPSYSASTVPQPEEELVLTLAESLVYRRRAGDVSKRRGMDASVSDLLQLAAALDQQYQDDFKRLRPAIGRVKEAPPAAIGSGDVVEGAVWRKSPRNGFKTPMAAAGVDPAPPTLQDPQEGDAEDTNVKVRWEKSTDLHFHSYELWMDTQEQVTPQRESILLSGLPDTNPDVNLGVDRPSTSKIVFRSFGANSNYSTVAFSTFIESYGQNITQFNVGTLEPDQDYFFRLRIVDLNFVARMSSVVRIRTMPMRVRFSSTPCTPTAGASGVTVTVNFDSTKGTPDSRTKVWIGGKLVTLTLTGPYTGTFVLPSFYQTVKAKDLVVEDARGLKDIKFEHFTVTA